MPIYIQQRPHHERLAMRIHEREERVDTPVRVPNAVERVIVGLVALPPGVLPRVVLRRDHSAIDTAPKCTQENLIHTAVLDADDVQLPPPRRLSRVDDPVKVPPRHLPLCIRTCLRLADETHPHARKHLIPALRLRELHPRARRPRARRVPLVAGVDAQTVDVVGGALVHPDPCICGFRAGKVKAEKRYVCPDAKGRLETPASCHSACLRVYAHVSLAACLRQVR
jgi:hypothetical protein